MTEPLKASVLKRLESHIAKTDTCWLWGGRTNKAGYAEFKIGNQYRLAHRLTYELARGAIPVGLQLDHLCRVRRCVNPSHLEPVTHRENALRGESFSAVNAAKTECVNGHPFDAANTYMWRGNRACRACRTRASQNYKSRLRAEKAAA